MPIAKTLPFLIIAGTLFASPNKPSDLKLKALSSHSVSIQWKDNSTNETGFKIFRDDKLITITPPDAQSYIDDNLSPNTTYIYTVKATDDLPMLRINEILASNKKTIQDPDYGKYADYIELYNASNRSVDLSGYGLGDTEGGSIWKLPQGTTIAPKGYLLIWADKKKNGLHTDFKLSSDGEAVILYDKNQKVIDHIVFSKQYDDIALGRDKANKQIFLKPTPNRDNKIDKNQVDPTVDTPAPPRTDIYINEFMASNVNSVMDTDYYEFSDWIELHNKSNHTIDIGGYKISDKPNKSGYTLPSGTKIPANANLIIWADKKSKGLHTNFSLKSDGESIVLSDRGGNIIDQIDFDKQKENISYGRDKRYVWGFMLPTYEQNNQALMNERAKKIKFSQDEGFYDSAIRVELSTKDSGEIHYTTDGSIPTKASPKYTKPLQISYTTVVRAISFKNGLLPSKVKTKTYFIGESKPTIPVVSLSVNSDYLYDDMIGIYVKGKNGAKLTCSDSDEKFNYAQEWYRPVTFEYFADGKEEVVENIDFAISGDCSRRFNAKKSFKFEASSPIKYNFYPQKTIESLEDFKLRTGNRGFEIGDTLAAALVADGNLDVEFQGFRIVKVYINGDYWGVYSIREKKGKDYLRSNFPEVNTKNVDIIKAWTVKAGDEEAFNQMWDYLKSHDLSNQSNYQYATSIIDENNFIDYLCVMIYSANYDWVGSNNRIWREKKDGAKWRWMLDDVDLGFKPSKVNENWFDYIANYRANSLLKQMYNSFMQSSIFRKKFKDRFRELLDTEFSPENVIRLADQQLEQKRAYMFDGKYGISQSTFDRHVSEVHEFAKKRADVVKKQLNNL